MTACSSARPHSQPRVAAEIFFEHLEDVGHDDGLGPGAPAVVVGGERDGREAELGLTRELGFLQVRHADHARAPAPVEIRLGARREHRPFHAQVRAALVHGRPGLANAAGHER
jgi:hypothetical protein